MKAPAPDGSQNDPLNTDIGRNARNTMMALPGIGGLPRFASNGGAISSGINAASSGINAASRMMTLAAGPVQAASNPYANVTPEQGRAMSEINAKAQMMDLSSAPTPYAPVQQPRSAAAIAMETTSDIKREGNSYSDTNVSGDFTINGQAPSNGGQISTKNQWKAVALQGGTDAQGNKTDSVLGAVNERTGEMKRMETGQGGAAGNPPKVSTQSSFDALPKGVEYIGADGRQYMK